MATSSSRPALSNITNQTPPAPSSSINNSSSTKSQTLYNLFSSSSEASTSSLQSSASKNASNLNSSPCFLSRKSRVLDTEEEEDGTLDYNVKRNKGSIVESSSGLGARKTISKFGNQQRSCFSMMERGKLGFGASSSSISHRPLLQTLVSHNELDVYRCHSSSAHRNFSPPFACTFSNAAKRGGTQIFAVASEEGDISLVNGSKDNAWDFEHGRTSFQAHRNAIFDLAWSKDDSMIATASGDQTSKLFDVETGQCLGVLGGHMATLKSVAWDPTNPSLLATGSRDGSVRIWDRRTSVEYEENAQGEATIGCVNIIKNAHTVKGGKASKTRSAVASVTSVLFLPHSSNLLASSGSSDGIIKFWDLRKLHSKRVNPAFVEDNIEAAVEERGSGRERGIVSMVINPNGNKIFSLGTDSLIKTYDPINLSYPAPLSTFSHPKLKSNTFYVRLVVSTIGSYIACGSSDGGVYAWDYNGNGTDAVRLEGHEKEVGGLDWGYNSIASCSDDNIFRVWKMNQDIANSRVEAERVGDKEIGYRWSGEDRS